MRVKILNEYCYQTFPITDDMVEVAKEDLQLIGKGKKFDLRYRYVVDDKEGYESKLAKQEKANKIRSLKLEILKLKQNLRDTDYKMMKYHEGVLSEEEYIELKQLRQEWRDEVNLKEIQIETIQGEV